MGHLLEMHLLEMHLLEKSARQQNLDCSTPVEQIEKKNESARKVISLAIFKK